MTAYLKVFDISDACVELPENCASPSLINSYARAPVELMALYDWVFKADRVVTPALANLSKKVSLLEGTPNNIRLYRGFNRHSYQESLGFDDMEEIELGMKGVYKTDDRSFSTSTDLEIAKKFGSIVVACDVNLTTCKHLRITDALAYLISKHQGLDKILTQREVILFPPVSVNYEVVYLEE